MAKAKEAAVVEQQTPSASEEITSMNTLTDPAVKAAFDEIEKEKDEKKKNEAKEAICIATYDNLKTRAELRARRREDDLTKEKLEGTKSLLERLLGVRTEIKDGKLVPTKEKVDPKERLTPTQYRNEKQVLREEITKKIRESNKILNNEIDEIQRSYEGRYRYYWD